MLYEERMPAKLAIKFRSASIDAIAPTSSVGFCWQFVKFLFFRGLKTLVDFKEILHFGQLLAAVIELIQH